VKSIHRIAYVPVVGGMIFLILVCTGAIVGPVLIIKRPIDYPKHWRGWF